MRLKMTPEQLMKDLLNSESFDDLVAYRLMMSLESTTEELTRLYNKRSWSTYNYDDYVDALRYARALVVVLSWFTDEEWDDAEVELNTFSVRLDQEFDLSKLPEGRHPLSNDWFREKAAAFRYEDIRPMTDEERQRASEKAERNNHV